MQKSIRRARSSSDPGTPTYTANSPVFFNRYSSEVFLANLPTYSEELKRMSYINFLSNEGSIPKVDPQSYRPVDSHVWSLSTDQKLWVRRSVDNNPTLADHLQDEECSSSQWQRFTLREGNTITFKKAVLWQEKRDRRRETMGFPPR